MIGNIAMFILEERLQAMVAILSRSVPIELSRELNRAALAALIEEMREDEQISRRQH